MSKRVKRVAVVIAAVMIVVCVFIPIVVVEWICGKANETFDAKDAAYTALEKKAKDSTFYWMDTASRLTDEKIALKVEVKKHEKAANHWTTVALGMNEDVSHWHDRTIKLEVEIAEWKACAERRNAELNEPVEILPVEPTFTDRIQTSLKGVVHLQAPQWQGSGFIVGPHLIVTARHCVEGVEDFLITTHDGHQVRATRAISDKEHDVAFLWVDDLACVAEERGTVEHDVALEPLPIGSITDCVLGQSVYVIGSPYGKINFNAVSLGIISGVNRDWNDIGGYDYGWEVAFTVDSAGHPGNSGCPVFTTDGVVRGILVGGFSPVLISVMPCDLFLPDLDVIRLMFTQDRYYREEAVEWDEYSYLRGGY